jgi:hypothetical protein
MSINIYTYRNRLYQMIYLRPPQVVLSIRIPWQEIDALLTHIFHGRFEQARISKTWISLVLPLFVPVLASQSLAVPACPCNYWSRSSTLNKPSTKATKVLVSAGEVHLILKYFSEK